MDNGIMYKCAYQLQGGGKRHVLEPYFPEGWAKYKE